MTGKKKIILVVSLGVIYIIFLFKFVVPFIGYYRISKGMTELDVKNILGEPEYDGMWNMSEQFFGYRPNLPENMVFRSLNYFIEDQIVIIILISSNDYLKLTGQQFEDEHWRVAEKDMHSKFITS